MSPCGSASIPATPIRWCAARWCCPTEPASRFACWWSPRASGSREAEAAGADFVGIEYIQKLKDGWLEADVIVATPDVMGQLGQLGRVLGPRGLMPNPEGRHGHHGRRQGGPRDQGRQDRVPGRQDRKRARAGGQGLVRARPARGQRVGASWTRSSGPSRRQPRAPTSARPPSPARWDLACVSIRRCTDEQDRTTGIRGVARGQVEGRTQRLRHRLQWPERAPDDRIPPPAPRGGGVLRGRQEHPGPARAGGQRHHHPRRASGRTHRA